jgi:hypothetical protein
MTEAQVEVTAIPEAVVIEGVVPEAEVLEAAASGPEVPIAPETTEEVRDDAFPESSMDVVVRLPEIQDVEPIRSAPMSEAVVWTSLGPLPRWVPGPTTRWAPRTIRLVPHGTCWREAHGPRWRSTRIGSYAYHVLCRGLLDVHD